jgi:hypothetical protein
MREQGHMPMLVRPLLPPHHPLSFVDMYVCTSAGPHAFARAPVRVCVHWSHSLCSPAPPHHCNEAAWYLVQQATALTVNAHTRVTWLQMPPYAPLRRYVEHLNGAKCKCACFDMCW